MTKQITAEISLSQEQWAILSICFTNSIPMLPKECWDVAGLIEKEIEEGLAKAKDKT